jgi:Ca2+-binding RTX toxin-like protein
MKRILVLLACMGLMVGLMAAVAYAATIEGTAQREILYESEGCVNGCDDVIRALAGDDEVYANFAPDGADKDIVRLGSGKDFGSTQDGDAEDVIYGGDGADTCDGDAGPGEPNDTFISCEVVQ